jgi:hypothetical protein
MRLAFASEMMEVCRIRPRTVREWYMLSGLVTRRRSVGTLATLQRDVTQSDDANELMYESR